MDVVYAIGTVVGIAGTMILRDYRDGKNIFKKNIPTETLHQGFDYMKHHYNDELTTTLTQIQTDQRQYFRDLGTSLDKINEALIRMESGGVRIRN